MPCAFARMEPSLLSVGRSRPTEVKIRETEGGELQLQGEEGREEKRERCNNKWRSISPTLLKTVGHVLTTRDSVGES